MPITSHDTMGTDATVALEYDPYTSRTHARMARGEHGVEIRHAKGSQNGTWVNWRMIPDNEALGTHDPFRALSAAVVPRRHLQLGPRFRRPQLGEEFETHRVRQALHDVSEHMVRARAVVTGPAPPRPTMNRCG